MTCDLCGLSIADNHAHITVPVDDLFTTHIKNPHWVLAFQSESMGHEDVACLSCTERLARKLADSLRERMIDEAQLVGNP
jgi:hypothetical protein